MGKKIDPTFADWRSGDQKVYISDIRKAEKEFSWKPEASFKEGFDLMLEWIRQNEKILKEFI